MPDNACPLCTQPVEVRRKAKDGTLAAAVVSLKEDVEAWAEGDVLADDGDLLEYHDLVKYIAGELAPVLMKVYSAEFRRHRTEREALIRRVSREQKIVDDVSEGRKPNNGTLKGAKAKATCRRGHERTPDNVTAWGQCRTCLRTRNRSVVGVEK